MNILLGIIIYLIFVFLTYLLVSTLDGKYSHEKPEDSVNAWVFGIAWPFTLLLGLGLLMMWAAIDWWDHLYHKVKKGYFGGRK
ncbi:hypothetical protein V8J08_003610 [Citrobacter amalonaticus]|uniref:hypothetical protein n=1 Tax=Citrobacter TaxID=544 RepID=UPI000CEC5F9E|nr:MULTISPECIES: hypothetical protein [Citrobacter]AUZ66649.1 hypothetical protein C2U53_24000 [Citrobacter sp. CFNIH10]MBJ8744054.1 hypothetical protein [Citrobacter farmeri]MBJ8758131.1 hypothetical protein [Citrobacter farmeri]